MQLNPTTQDKFGFFIKAIERLIINDACDTIVNKTVEGQKYYSLYLHVLKYLEVRGSIFTTLDDETIKVIEIKIKDLYVYGKDLTLNPPLPGFNFVELLNQFVSDLLSSALVSERDWIEFLNSIINARQITENAKDTYSKLLKDVTYSLSTGEYEFVQVKNAEILKLALNYPFIAALLIFEILRFYIKPVIKTS